jgi:hypothetical protein
MQQGAARPDYPEIRQLVMEASQALAQLDAARLEELALSCKALNREINRELRREQSSARDSNRVASPGLHPSVDTDLNPDAKHPFPIAAAKPRAQLARQAREAQGEMAVFARVLEGTRSNLNVSSPAAGGVWSQPGQSSTARSSPELSSPVQASPVQPWMERGHGDD